MTEVVQFKHYIKVRGAEEDLLPIGSIYELSKESDRWELADGRHVRTSDYPELYAIWGDGYCPREIPTQDLTLWAGIKRFLGVDVPHVYVANPDYREGWFRFPDLRGRWA